jgi:hypothetical protein
MRIFLFNVQQEIIQPRTLPALLIEYFFRIQGSRFKAGY